MSEEAKSWICTTCGIQYEAAVNPPKNCPICEDERQFVNWNGQEIEAEITDLLTVAKDESGSASTESRLATLDPYDAAPDRYGIMGFSDGIAVIRRTCRALHIPQRPVTSVSGKESIEDLQPEPPPAVGL